VDRRLKFRHQQHAHMSHLPCEIVSGTCLHRLKKGKKCCKSVKLDLRVSFSLLEAYHALSTAVSRCLFMHSAAAAAVPGLAAFLAPENPVNAPNCGHSRCLTLAAPMLACSAPPGPLRSRTSPASLQPARPGRNACTTTLPPPGGPLGSCRAHV
jgi:hypothetical protein